MSNRYVYMPMPVNAQGQGPETDSTKVKTILHEVWLEATNETVCTCYNEAIARQIANLLSHASVKEPDYDEA